MQNWRIISLTLLIGACSITAYFGWKFASEAWNHHRLTAEIPAKVVCWEIEEVGSLYAIFGVYEVKNLIHKDRIGPLFLNEAAAIEAMKEKAKGPLIAYFDPQNPGRTALEREFPTSYGIRLLISLFVLIYFLIFSKKLESIFNQKLNIINRNTSRL